MKLFRMIKNGIRDAFKSVVRKFSLSIAGFILLNENTTSLLCTSTVIIVITFVLKSLFNGSSLTLSIKWFILFTHKS